MAFPRSVRNIEEPPLLDTHDLARLLGLSPDSLKNWRKRSQRKEGQNFIRVGRRIRYSLEDVRRYLKNRTVQIKGRKRIPKPPCLPEKK